MKLTWFFITLVFSLLAGVGCGGENPAGDVSATPSPPEMAPARASSGMGTFFAINEVGLGPNGFVALTNFTDVPASLDGLYLCQGSECSELPDVVVGADQTVRIAVGDGAGHEDVVATRATLGDLQSSDGEIALYASREFEDPQAMLVYFQWGSTPHELTQTAIDAGLWVRGGYGPSSQNATRLFKVAAQKNCLEDPLVQQLLALIFNVRHLVPLQDDFDILGSVDIWDHVILSEVRAKNLCAA